jgi:hypothetical protein
MRDESLTRIVVAELLNLRGKTIYGIRRDATTWAKCAGKGLAT